MSHLLIIAKKCRNCKHFLQQISALFFVLLCHFYVGTPNIPWHIFTLPCGCISRQTAIDISTADTSDYSILRTPLTVFHALLLRTSIRLSKPSGALFHQLSCDHHHMTAAHAFQPEICAHTQDFPLLTSARMRLFQFYNISYFIYHTQIPLFLFLNSSFLKAFLKIKYHGKRTIT